MSNKYTVKQLAELSGITVRTLHHYDKRDLLKPAMRSEKKYRYYTSTELLRLQQILFYRELDFTLEQTRRILDDEAFDFSKALRDHRKSLLQKHKRIKQLIQTLDQTLQNIEGTENMVHKDEDLYKGFDQEKIQRWNQEIDKKYDPEVVAESRRRIGKMSKDTFDNVKEQGEAVTWAIAENMHMEASSPETQALISKHHLWIENYYSCSAEMYKGLGQLYVENPEFTAYYEKFKPGLATYMSQAMGHYAERELANS